jgi:hypothetical protein
MRGSGKGLIKDSSDWNRVKEQIESGLWDVSRQIPHRRILDYNISEKNWPSERYDYASFASSVRQLVNQLNLNSGNKNTGKLFTIVITDSITIPSFLSLDAIWQTLLKPTRTGWTQECPPPFQSTSFHLVQN